jgi:hypothetical protein
MPTQPTRHTLADKRANQPAFPPGVPNGTAEWDAEALLAYIANADVQIAALEPAEVLLDCNALSTPELDELSAADTPEAVAQIEARIRQRIADRQEQLQQMKPRKVKVIR